MHFKMNYYFFRKTNWSQRKKKTFNEPTHAKDIIYKNNNLKNFIIITMRKYTFNKYFL